MYSSVPNNGFNVFAYSSALSFENFAAAIQAGVPVDQVYRAYIADQKGDVVVVGNSLVDRKTRKVLFTAPSSGMGGGFTYKDASGNVISLDLGKLNDSQSQSMAFGSRMQLANIFWQTQKMLERS